MRLDNVLIKQFTFQNSLSLPTPFTRCHRDCTCILQRNIDVPGHGLGHNWSFNSTTNTECTIHLLTLNHPRVLWKPCQHVTCQKWQLCWNTWSLWSCLWFFNRYTLGYCQSLHSIAKLPWKCSMPHSDWELAVLSLPIVVSGKKCSRLWKVAATCFFFLLALSPMTANLC